MPGNLVAEAQKRVVPHKMMERKCIRSGLGRIKKQISSGNESEIWFWVIAGRLACSQRPLRYHPKFCIRTKALPLLPEARPFVEYWVDRVVAEGFRSVISLLEVVELKKHYVNGGINLHREGLLGYYRSRGLTVESIPCTNFQAPTDAQKHKALEAYRSLPKPVLLHCSGGIDRTPPVAAFIVEQEN